MSKSNITKILCTICTLFFSSFLCAQIIATVNGKTIDKKKFDSLMTFLIKQGAKDSPALRNEVKHELIVREILVQAAEKKKINRNSDVLAQIDLSKQAILIRELMNEHMKQYPVTDKMIQSEYDRMKNSQIGKSEYKMKHILVNDEKLANDLIKQLEIDPNRFTSLARDYSKDASTSDKGGDLGWSTLNNYVAPISKALERMKKGEISSKPINTQFGWHILYLDSIRLIEIPSFDQIKGRIEEAIRQNILMKYQSNLIKEASIKGLQ